MSGFILEKTLLRATCRDRAKCATPRTMRGLTQSLESCGPCLHSGVLQTTCAGILPMAVAARPDRSTGWLHTRISARAFVSNPAMAWLTSPREKKLLFAKRLRRFDSSDTADYACDADVIRRSAHGRVAGGIRFVLLALNQSGWPCVRRRRPESQESEWGDSLRRPAGRQEVRSVYRYRAVIAFVATKRNAVDRHV
jgi:hypothetical protein